MLEESCAHFDKLKIPLDPPFQKGEVAIKTSPLVKGRQRGFERATGSNLLKAIIDS
jgi:hypothetical protein